MKTLIWLDDERDPENKPKDKLTWLELYAPSFKGRVIWLKSYSKFIEFITLEGLPNMICFDHDLGGNIARLRVSEGMNKKKARLLKSTEKTGYDAAKWLVEYCLDKKLELPKWAVQSANPIGRGNINGILNNFIKRR